MNKIKLTLLLLLSMFLISFNMGSAWAAKSSKSNVPAVVKISVRNYTYHELGKPTAVFVRIQEKEGYAIYTPFWLNSSKKATDIYLDTEMYGPPPYKVLFVAPIGGGVCDEKLNDGETLGVDGVCLSKQYPVTCRVHPPK